MSRIRARVPGIPRTPREALTSLQVLATLRQQGWHRSVAGGAPATYGGAPCPWFTYAAVEWLACALTEQTRLFEYGAGASTAWFARRIGEIHAVEHDEAWFGRLRQPHNGRIVLRPHPGDWWHGQDDTPYVQAIGDGAPWDVVVIDGAARTACARVAADHLTETGLVVLDDTNSPASTEAQQVLGHRGLGRLDFWGFKPGVGTSACTTIFGRDLNPWLHARTRRTSTDA